MKQGIILHWPYSDKYQTEQSFCIVITHRNKTDALRHTHRAIFLNHAVNHTQNHEVNKENLTDKSEHSVRYSRTSII